MAKQSLQSDVAKLGLCICALDEHICLLSYKPSMVQGNLADRKVLDICTVLYVLPVASQHVDCLHHILPPKVGIVSLCMCCQAQEDAVWKCYAARFRCLRPARQHTLTKTSVQANLCCTGFETCT